MTLRELSNTNLFPGDTKIFFEGHNGNRFWVLEFDYKATISNCTTFFNDTVLNREILYIQAYGHDTILVVFKGE